MPSIVTVFLLYVLHLNRISNIHYLTMAMTMMMITSVGDKLNVITSTGFGSVTIFRSHF